MDFCFNVFWAFTATIAPVTVVGVLLELIVKGFISVISGNWHIGDFFKRFDRQASGDIWDTMESGLDNLPDYLQGSIRKQTAKDLRRKGYDD